MCFSNKVNEDLIADYNEVEVPPTERFRFNTSSYSREETKQSMMKSEWNGNRKTNRELHNTESTFNYFNTKVNNSFTSDKSIKINELYKSESSRNIAALESGDSSRKMYTNITIDKNLMNQKDRNYVQTEGDGPYYDNNITVSTLIKRKGKDRDRILTNIISIKDSKDEVEHNNGKSSPYFTTNLKGFKSNRVTSSNKDSNNSAHVSFFNKNISNNITLIDSKGEMNIQEESVNVEQDADDYRHLTELEAIRNKFQDLPYAQKTSKLAKHITGVNLMNKFMDAKIVPREISDDAE